MALRASNLNVKCVTFVSYLQINVRPSVKSREGLRKLHHLLDAALFAKTIHLDRFHTTSTSLLKVGMLVRREQTFCVCNSIPGGKFRMQSQPPSIMR